MVNRTHVSLKAADRSYFAILKKQIHALALQANFSNSKIGEIDIIVAELVSNMVKHANGGDVLVKLIESADMQGLEIIGFDVGPGISDVPKMMIDGVSTKNTLGQGLGAIQRLSDFFQIYTLPDWGTVMTMRVYAEELPFFRKAPAVEVRSVIVPKSGETACGDGFFQHTGERYVKLFLGDGLGHGPEAEKAVVTAGEHFLQCTQTEPVEILREINNVVKKTRGLVGTLVTIDLKERLWKICGVGNISTKIITGGQAKNYLPYNGIIGLNVPRTLTSQEISFEQGQQLIMCSDGIKSRWELTKYPGIQRYDPSVIAATIFKDFTRTTDDTAVVVCKLNM
jgi:anti-sigma regulatory factor (Ser/Thr protein kinase)